MMKLRTPATAPIVEIEASGRITRAELESVFAEIEAARAWLASA